MKILTKECIEANANIPTHEVQRDIEITNSEIEDYEKLIAIYKNNPVENKTKIYFAQGNIIKRKELVSNLQQILEYRTLSIQQ